MIRKLCVIDGCAYLALEPALLEALSLDADTPLDVRVENGALIVRPLVCAESVDLLEVADAIMDLHNETFRKLAL